MKNAFLTITREDHDVEIEVSPDNTGVGYVMEDTPRYDDEGVEVIGMLYLADESIPLTLLEEEEARERLEEANQCQADSGCEPMDRMSGDEADRAADSYFQNRFKR